MAGLACAAWRAPKERAEQARSIMRNTKINANITFLTNGDGGA
jgi:hypothetical protein